MVDGGERFGRGTGLGDVAAGVGSARLVFRVRALEARGVETEVDLLEQVPEAHDCRAGGTLDGKGRVLGERGYEGTSTRRTRRLAGGWPYVV